MKQKTAYMSILFLSVLLCSVSSVAAENLVIVDFYYSESCGSCHAYIPIIDNITAVYNKNYSGQVIILKKEVGSNATNRQEMRDRGMSFPSVVINNETKIPKSNLTYNELVLRIDEYIEDLGIHTTYDQNVIDIPGFGRVNLTSFSLPVLTIVLGSLDSLNPCSFFILIFLLNLLLYLQSRRRILLVGGIFIFFSALFYLLFMFLLFSSLLLTKDHIIIISFIAGIIAILIGFFSIKDFFFFKKGPSLSLSEKKQKETFKNIRKLIKSPSLLAMLGGTIVLAVSVNFFELLCTLGLPLIYTSRLAALNLPVYTYYTYIFFYNVVYVIPLIIILLVFTFTLGKMKLTEWQGRILKLFPGLVIVTFGIFFIVDYQALENLTLLLAMVGLDALITIILAFLWKKYNKIPDETQP